MPSHGFFVTESAQAPGARGARVGERLQRGEGLGADDKQRLGRLEVAHAFREIGAVHVGDETERHVSLTVMAQRFVRHDRAQVGAADTDVDDIANALARVTGPTAAAHASRKTRHAVEHRVDVWHDVSAIDEDAFARRRAQRDMQDRALFGSVDLVAAEHGIDPLAQGAGFGKRHQQAQRLVGDAVLRIVQVDAGRFRDQPFATRWIGGKQLAEVPAPDLSAMLSERAPLRTFRQRLRFRRS